MVLKYQSQIERDQLGPHLRQLVQVGLLASYHFSKAARGTGFVITFRPGAAFFHDYERFYRSRHQGELQYEFHSDRRDIAEPLKVAYLFLEKRSGKPVKEIPYVSTKDVETAKQFLAQVRFEEMPQFFDYAFSEASKTKFDVRSLGGLKQYLDGYRQSCRDQANIRAGALARQAREREEALQTAYQRHRRASALALFSSLSSSEQAVIEELARPASRSFGNAEGPLAATLFELAKTRVILERHPNAVQCYEVWQASRISA